MDWFWHTRHRRPADRSRARLSSAGSAISLEAGAGGVRGLKLLSNGTALLVTGTGRIHHRPGYSLDNGILSFEPQALAHGFVAIGDSGLRVLRLDNRGRFIPNIPQAAFRVLEDGVPQRVISFGTGEQPITLAMVIEFSGLFQQYWSFGWQETLTATYGFVQTLKPEDMIAVVAFDLRPEILSDFSNNRQETYEALARLRVPGFSESNLYDALTEVADRMSDIEGRKAILYIGSGMDTFSRITFDQCRRKLQTAGVPIYALGTLQALREWYDARGWLGPIARLDFLQADNQLRTFARETGGFAWFPRFFGEYGGIFRQINEALRNTYSLAYQPTNVARDGKQRKIKVELIGEGGQPLRVVDERGKPIKYQIVHKTGYTAPREVE